MIKIDYLKPWHIKQLDGASPAVSVRGVAVLDNDDVLCICCTTMVNEDFFVMFCCKPEIANHKKAIIKGWRFFEQFLTRETYFAIRDKEASSSDSFLKHFGFEPLNDNVYIYRG